MYRTGHYGAALLAYAPVGAAVGLVAPELAVLGGAGILLLSTLPDFDLRVPLVPHRGPTHTLLFVLVVSGLLGTAGWVASEGLPNRPALAAFAAVVGLVGVGSHLLADALTPAGIEPFWPVSTRNYSLGVTRANNPVANWLLLGLGVAATAAAVVVVGRLQ